MLDIVQSVPACSPTVSMAETAAWEHGLDSKFWCVSTSNLSPHQHSNAPGGHEQGKTYKVSENIPGEHVRLMLSSVAFKQLCSDVACCANGLGGANCLCQKLVFGDFRWMVGSWKNEVFCGQRTEDGPKPAKILDGLNCPRFLVHACVPKKLFLRLFKRASHAYASGPGQFLLKTTKSFEKISSGKNHVRLFLT